MCVCVFFVFRRSPGGAGEAVHPEAPAVLRPLRLPVRPTERPEMEGGEARGAERDGRVHHAQPQRHHGAHLPRGGAHGEFRYCDSSVYARVESRKLLLNHGVGAIH